MEHRKLTCNLGNCLENPIITPLIIIILTLANFDEKARNTYFWTSNNTQTGKYNKKIINL